MSSKRPKEITTIAELQAACDKKLKVRFEFHKKVCVIEVRNLRPNELAILSERLCVVIPPITRGKTVEEDRPEYANADYVKRKAAEERICRSLALYWCVPSLSANKPDLTDPNQIHEFVQSRLNEEILETLYIAVREGGITAAQLVNLS